jgi:hypothetical protein
MPDCRIRRAGLNVLPLVPYGISLNGPIDDPLHGRSVAWRAAQQVADDGADDQLRDQISLIEV